MNAGENRPGDVKYFMTPGLAMLEVLRNDHKLAVGSTITRRYSEGRYFLVASGGERVQYMRNDGSVS